MKFEKHTEQNCRIPFVHSFVRLKMKHGVHLCISVGILMLVLCHEIPGFNAEDSRNSNLSCHYKKHNESLVKQATLDEIDKNLGEFYGLVKTNASYEDDCTLSLKFSIERDGKMVKIQVNDLMKMLEAIEVLRDRYSKGMWGYCGEQGAKELIANITGLKGTANDSVVILCDRDRFLYCHPRFGKCQCIKANRGFQEVASSFWEQTEGNKIFNQSIGNGQCALITGSDCPIHRDLNHDFPKKYPCEPGNRCLYKANKKPCDTDPKHIPKSFRTDSKTQRRLGSELETSAQDYQRSSSEQNAFIRQTLNQNTTTAGAMKYRIFRSDFPSVHCQCYGYIGGGAVDYVQSGIGMSFGTFWIALFFLFKP